MKLLVLALDYPKPGRLFSGIFNERSVVALKELRLRGGRTAALAHMPHPKYLDIFHDGRFMRMHRHMRSGTAYRCIDHPDLRSQTTFY